ncbi:MAG: hypothetical protein MUC39_06410 [Candidatus Omnitrophica bacterium]|nr:hypothetical protein [Candidatus Omnitrophota bacterium]
MRKKIILLSVIIGALYIGFVLFKTAYKPTVREVIPEISIAETEKTTVLSTEEKTSKDTLPVAEQKKSQPPENIPKYTEKGVFLR